MGKTTKIGWTDATWNPTRGCSRVSAGCENCYAERVASRFGQKQDSPYYGLTVHGSSGPRWTGVIKLASHVLLEPLRWREPRSIFVNSMSDLFHEGIPDRFIDVVFAVMALADRHRFQILTKRPERMRSYVADARPRVLAAMVEVGAKVEREWSKAQLLACYAATMPQHEARETWPIRNVWLGVSAEDQWAADARIPILLETPAALRFVSVEPMLGPIEMEDYLTAVDPCPGWPNGRPPLEWVIVGGESGPRARQFDLGWASRVQADCKASGVPFFMKQLGAFPTRVHEGLGVIPVPISDRKGEDQSDWPLGLRVQEIPAWHA